MPRLFAALSLSLPLALFLALAHAGAALAQDACAQKPVRGPVFYDRCNASFIQVDTPAGLLDVHDKSAPSCFAISSPVWSWRCRGFAEKGRCRTKSQTNEVRVTLNNGQVKWECLAP